MRQEEIDARVLDLYDEYCHGHIDRREFFQRAAQLTVASVSAVTMAEALLPNYADAQEILLSSALFAKAHELSNGKLGATGFCSGGGTTNYLATELGDELDAALQPGSRATGMGQDGRLFYRASELRA